MVFIILLMAVGVLLLLVEIFLASGAGVAGIIGIISLGGSCFYAFKELGASAGTLVTVINTLLLVVMVISHIRIKTWKKLVSSAGDRKSGIFMEPAIAVGDQGRTVTALAPSGTAVIGNAAYSVTSLEGSIESGTEVQIVLIEDGRIYVSPVTEDF